MYSSISTAVIFGIESIPVRVEADVTDGMPQFDMVGYLSGEVREARERVRTALNNSGYRLPPKKITINLTPANIRKSGNGCDLPVAAAILSAMGYTDPTPLEQYMILGEVGLDGSVLPVTGVLSSVLLAADLQMKGVILPFENAKEAALCRTPAIFPVRSLQEFVALCTDGFPPHKAYSVQPGGSESGLSDEKEHPDFCDVHGQPLARYASEIAASGMHNLLLVGPPGAGKSMLAKRIPGILPELTRREMLEVSRIYSSSGLLTGSSVMHSRRPFRAPHHTITAQAMAGGGSIPKPGEVSLAHRGVLFLDEFAEYDPKVLETLREPLEDGTICISRVDGSFVYPADFLLLAAMNPCKCGYYPDMNRCTCSVASIRQYISRLSRPLLDRIDLCVQMQEMTFEDVMAKTPNESSAEIRARVKAAWEIQRERFRGREYLFNSQIPAKDMERFCFLPPEVQAQAKEQFLLHNLTMRSWHKLLRVSRTIADMEGSDSIQLSHYQKALLFRGLDQSFWRIF